MPLETSYHFHETEPRVHYSEGTIWLEANDGATRVVFFLPNPDTALAARRVAAQLVMCAEQAEAAASEKASLVEVPAPAGAS